MIDASRLRAVVFDFDGTLVDSYPGITASVNHLRTLYGLPPLPVAEVRRHVGRGPIHLLHHTVPGGDPERDLERYKEHHPSVMKTGTHLFPEVLDVLVSLKGQRLLLAICSNKPREFTLGLLEHLGLAALFDVVVGPEDVARHKPHPEMLKKVLERLAVAGAEALYVGDMVVDIETARGAGVTVWVVPTGSDSRSTLAAGKPDRLLESLVELPALLNSPRPAAALFSRDRPER